MKKKGWKILFIAAITAGLLTLTNTLTASAHECSPRRFPKTMRYHYGMGKQVVYLTYDMSHVYDSNYRAQVLNAVNDWN